MTETSYTRWSALESDFSVASVARHDTATRPRTAGDGTRPPHSRTPLPCCALSSPRQPPAPIACPPVGTRSGQIGWLGVKLGPHQDVRRQMRTLIRCAGSVALLFLSAGLLSAEDG